MNLRQFEEQYTEELTRDVDIECPEHLIPLRNHLMGKIAMKMAALIEEGHEIEVLDPEWCRANSETAGKMHAEVIIGTYGSTYALPNKDPSANKIALESNALDLYLFNINGESVGTACMVDCGDGYAELGRSASQGKAGNSIIQNMRILDWLSENNLNKRYHTLFTTLRSAPDRIIKEADGTEFTMRGGEAVTNMWKQFPGLAVNGIAPLYLKHGALEKFTVAEFCKDPYLAGVSQVVENDSAQDFISSWHSRYGLDRPQFKVSTDAETVKPRLSAAYPPTESGLTNLVHADVVVTNKSRGIIFDSIEEVDDHLSKKGSPFTQLLIPTTSDHGGLLHDAMVNGYRLFGYRPATLRRAAALMLGKAREGIEIIPTYWEQKDLEHPFWGTSRLSEIDNIVNRQWKT